ARKERTPVRRRGTRDRIVSIDIDASAWALGEQVRLRTGAKLTRIHVDRTDTVIVDTLFAGGELDPSHIKRPWKRCARNVKAEIVKQHISRSDDVANNVE